MDHRRNNGTGQCHSKVQNNEICSVSKSIKKNSELTGRPEKTIRFRFDTPESIDLMDGDVIEAFWQQIEGGKPEDLDESKINTRMSRLNLISHQPDEHQTYCSCHKPTILRRTSLEERYMRMRRR